MLLALLWKKLLQYTCHGPSSPPSAAIAGAAVCPLKCSCVLELGKSGARLGSTLLRNQGRRMAVEMAVKAKRKKITGLTSEGTSVDASPTTGLVPTD